MSAQKCPKCGVWIKHVRNFTRHVNHCGLKKYSCGDCGKLFSRKDALKRHTYKAHPKRSSSKEFACQQCNKTFTYEATLKHHEKTCRQPKPKRFKCPTCGKAFASKSNWKHHKKYAHQKGGKRKRENQEESVCKRRKLPEAINQVYQADKEVSTMKGLKVNASFYPKTESQKIDQQVFFQETLPRVKLYLENILKQKQRGIKWNLVYHCRLTMPDKYREVPLKHSP